MPVALILLWVVQQNARPTDEVADEALPALGRGIIYLSPASGAAQLFHIDVDTEEVQQVGDAEAVTSFDVRADGGSLVYSAANALGGSDLWTLELRTRQSQLLLDCAAEQCSQPSFSPDGEQVAYQVDFAEVWLLDLDSGEGEQISPRGQLSNSPQWSRDGRLSYYNLIAERYEVVLPGTGMITRHPNQAGERLGWTADGSRFVAAEQFVREADSLPLEEGSPAATDDAAVPTASPESIAVTGERLVSHLLGYALNEAARLFDVGENLVEDTSPAFSPDGRWLAFTRKYLDEERWTPGRQLWLYEMESGLALAFTDSPNFQISAPTWSGDSAQIAFLRSNRGALNEPLELWVIHVNGSGARLLVVDAFAPQWVR